MIEVSIGFYQEIDEALLHKLLVGQGFVHNGGTNTYNWFDFDGKSTVGCLIMLHRNATVNRGGIPSDFSLYCRTITIDGRSKLDYQKQLDTIGFINKVFSNTGVVFTNEREVVIKNTIRDFSREEILISRNFEKFSENLEIVSELIETINEKEVAWRDALKSYKGQRNLMRNNTLLPFMVSIMESFFKDTLCTFIKVDDERVNDIFENKAKEKLTFAEVQGLLYKKVHIVDIILDKYNFQNLDSVQKAYGEYVSKTFGNMIFRKSAGDYSEKELYPVLAEMLEKRHKIIHEARIDVSLNETTMINYYQALVSLNDHMIEYFRENHALEVNAIELLKKESLQVK